MALSFTLCGERASQHSHGCSSSSLRCAGTCSSALRCCQRPAPTAHPAVPRSAGARREMGNKQLKSCLVPSPALEQLLLLYSSGQFIQKQSPEIQGPRPSASEAHTAQRLGCQATDIPPLIQLVKQSAGLETTREIYPGWLKSSKGQTMAKALQ